MSQETTVYSTSEQRALDVLRNLASTGRAPNPVERSLLDQYFGALRGAREWTMDTAQAVLSRIEEGAQAGASVITRELDRAERMYRTSVIIGGIAATVCILGFGLPLGYYVLKNGLPGLGIKLG